METVSRLVRRARYDWLLFAERSLTRGAVDNMVLLINCLPLLAS
jgi:hypothetical protein